MKNQLFFSLCPQLKHKQQSQEVQFFDFLWMHHKMRDDICQMTLRRTLMAFFDYQWKASMKLAFWQRSSSSSASSVRKALIRDAKYVGLRFCMKNKRIQEQQHCWRLKSCVCLPHNPLILLSKPLLKSASPIILHTSTVFPSSPYCFSTTTAVFY